jgi:hypothetical protein
MDEKTIIIISIVLVIIVIITIITKTNDYLTIEEQILNKIGYNSVIISDFDNTILNGDITFGSPEGYFKGMMRVLYDNNIKSLVPGSRLPSQKELDDMYEKFPEYNVVYNLSLFAGNSYKAISELAIKTYDEVYKNYLLDRTINFLVSAAKKGARIVILTASPSVYLSGFKKTYNWEVIGVETQNREGIVSQEPISAPYGPYKTEIVKNIMKTGNVIAGFGNNDTNDKGWLTFLKSKGCISVFVNNNDWTPV